MLYFYGDSMVGVAFFAWSIGMAVGVLTIGWIDEKLTQKSPSTANRQAKRVANSVTTSK